MVSPVGHTDLSPEARRRGPVRTRPDSGIIDLVWKRGFKRRLNVVAAFAIGLSVWVALPAGAKALGLGFQDGRFDSPVTAPGAFTAMQAVHGSWLRRPVNWSQVAPNNNFLSRVSNGT